MYWNQSFFCTRDDKLKQECLLSFELRSMRHELVDLVDIKINAWFPLNKINPNFVGKQPLSRI